MRVLPFLLCQMLCTAKHSCLLKAHQYSVENIHGGAGGYKRWNGCGGGIEWSVSNAASLCVKRGLPSLTWARMAVNNEAGLANGAVGVQGKH